MVRNKLEQKYEAVLPKYYEIFRKELETWVHRLKGADAMQM